MYRMEKFSDFIVEQKDEAYKLIVFNNSTEKRRDVGDTANYEFNLLIKFLYVSGSSFLFFTAF